MSRRADLEAQLKTTTDALARRGAKLTADKKIPAGKKARKAHRKDPAFRALEAEIAQFKRRIGALDAIDKLNADLVERRAVKAATPKVKKEKKKAPAPAPKKGGGEKKAKAPKAEG